MPRGGRGLLLFLLTLGWSETRMNVGEGAGDGEEEVAGVDEEDGGRARADLGVYSSVKQRLRKREPRRFRSTGQVGSSWSMATVARDRRWWWLSVGFLSRKKIGWRRRVRGRRRARVGLETLWLQLIREKGAAWEPSHRLDSDRQEHG
jgi:hypothetical protein